MVFYNVFAPIIYKKRLFSTPIVHYWYVKVALLYCNSGTIGV